MARNYPRLVIAGLSGDAGKTITSLSLITALRRAGRSVAAFKKGPDYIDAAWLTWASGTACRNLDTYLVDEAEVAQSFATAAAERDIAVVEGNRGLFDGKDAAGTHSTASLARLLGAPVILVVNGTKSTRTVAAMVKGCQVMEPDLKLAGVVLNQVSGERHRQVITEAIKQTCGLPVVGCIPRLSDAAKLIPGRHLGLVTPAEFGDNSALKDRLREIAEKYLDLEQIIALAEAAEPLSIKGVKRPESETPKARIGYFRDTVFTFYYPENLEALEQAGAELVPVSSLTDKKLPDLDGLYIGGGFPETQAEELCRNAAILDAVKAAADNGMPIYAECGGLIFLSRSLRKGDNKYVMAGVLPLDLMMQAKPAGHGYAALTIDRPNPFFETGTQIRGHEFHYSRPCVEPAESCGCAVMTTGVGLGNGRDGIVYNNCMACYTHIHASGFPIWAKRFTESAIRYRQQRSGHNLQVSTKRSQETKVVEPSEANLSPQLSVR